MQITLHTEGWFDAAHHLKNYKGACKNLHGHTYKCEVWVKGDEEMLDANGILWDFGNLKQMLNSFDHNGDLTDMMNKNSTAENQVKLIYGLLKTQKPNLNFKVRLYEQIQPKESYAEVGDF